MPSDGAFLDAAATIGSGLAASAVWHGDRCAWVGAEADVEEPSRPHYRALAGDIYDGTAGVALFLAELGAVTGDPAHRSTAAGAIRHAASRAPTADGFHAGPVGIAWAAVRVAAVLDEDELAAAGRALLARCSPTHGTRRSPDVILGAAGEILGRVALAGVLRELSLLPAVTAGEALLAGATVDEHGWSWAAPGTRTPRHLCGLSHGASGIGWALLELFVATGDERFREGADGAFAYERSWLDPVAGTWPDHRLPGQRRGRPHRFPSPAVGTWCHGEAGIALVRLRARAALGPHADRGDADLALAAARSHLAAALPYAFEDLSLCHGLSGTADVLLDTNSQLSAELGHTAIERHADAGDWPCAAPGGDVPGLFRGLAGIGWFLLRLHDPSVASPVRIPLRLDTLENHS